MCARRDAVHAVRDAADRLAAACLAHVPEPIGDAIKRAFPVDPVVPEEQAELLAKIAGSK